MSTHKVKVTTIVNDYEVEITYREMTEDEIKMGQFFKKLLGTKEPEQSSAIVRYNPEITEDGRRKGLSDG